MTKKEIANQRKYIEFKINNCENSINKFKEQLKKLTTSCKHDYICHCGAWGGDESYECKICGHWK